MLAVIPDYNDEDISSDSADERETRSKRGGNGSISPSTGKAESSSPDQIGLLRSSLSPGVAGRPNISSPLVAPTLAVVKTTLSRDQLQKFLQLREKRLSAAEEKVNEGWRHRRRRKRRRHPNSTQDHTVTHKRSSAHFCSKSTDEVSPAEGSAEGKGSISSQKQQEHWDTLKGYLHVNDHMSQGVDHGKYAPKSGLEKKLDESVAVGDFEEAEKLSDQLATRDLGCKIAKAADARDYVTWKLETEEQKAAKKRKKRKKLAWGFEVKNRWEMKANM